MAKPRPRFHLETGQFLARLRDSRGWSQRQAASVAKRKKLDLGEGQLRFLEEGKTKHPDSDLLAAVAALYDLPYAELARRFVQANYGSRDLVWHVGGGDSSAPEVSPYGPASARILELEETAARYRETISALEGIAARLAELTRGKDDDAGETQARPRRVRGTHHR